MAVNHYQLTRVSETAPMLFTTSTISRLSVVVVVRDTRRERTSCTRSLTAAGAPLTSIWRCYSVIIHLVIGNVILIKLIKIAAHWPKSLIK